MIAPARLAAYEILRAISSGRSDLPTAIAEHRLRLSDDRDRALAADIATGVQRWRARIDHLVEAFARRRLARLDAEVVEILRLSIYQLLHLTRVPAAAVVDDAVKMTGKAGKRSASGLVNAVLRAVSRGRDQLPLPPRPTSANDRDAALDYLAITLSHPRWLAARWLDRLGFERAEAWMNFANRPAPLTLRANRSVIDRRLLAEHLGAQAITTHETIFAPDGLLVDAGQPLANPHVDPAWFVVQDEASQLVALLAGESPGARILDTCASPGGKTTAMAARFPSAQVAACDVRDRRIDLLRQTVRRTGVGNVTLTQADLLRGLPFGAVFSTVLVDVPCSGLGTLRRDPDLRWRRQEADLAPLAAAQRVMLQNAAAAVAPGGRLIYATCSSEPEENEAVAAAFLVEQATFRAVPRDRVHPQLAPVLTDKGELRTEPDRHGLEAFYGAVFERSTQL